MKNARAILRNALPVDNKPIRKVAQELESITESLRIPGKGAYGPVSRAVNSASKTFTSQQASIVKAFADDKKASGTAAIASLTTAFKDLEQAASAKGDKGDIFEYQQECLRYVGQIQEAMVKKFPFEVCMGCNFTLHRAPVRRFGSSPASLSAGRVAGPCRVCRSAAAEGQGDSRDELHSQGIPGQSHSSNTLNADGAGRL